VALLDEAISLDSTFAVAWSELSATLATLYSNVTPDPALASRAKSAAERALALDPNGPTGHFALSRFHFFVRNDFRASEQEATLGLTAAPNNADLLSAAASAEKGLGQFDAALVHLRQARQLDPRSVRTADRLQNTLLWLRRYPEALAASEASLSLAPGDLSVSQDKAMVYVAQGNLEAAHEVIRQVSPAVKQSELVAYFANFWDMYWVLDDSQQRLVLGLGPDAFDSDRSVWATTLMQVYELRGDRAKARAYADTAYAATTQQLRGAPADVQRRVLTGLQLAHMGRKAEAIEAGLRGLALAPITRDATNGPYYQQLMARIYLMVGEPEKAIDMLEPLLKMPYFLSPGWLRIDPTWASLKGNPRFERLIAEH
jgi:tetratricopeptide (TPR) repeat protein